MIDHVAVDFKGTFDHALFMGVEPKMVRADKENQSSPQVQARDKETNAPKWTVSLTVQYKRFDRTKNDTMTVTVASPQIPCQGFNLGQPVALVGCEMGVMKQEKSGFSLFWDARDVVPVGADGQVMSSRNGAAAGQAAR